VVQLPQNHQRESMPRFTISVDDELNEYLENLAEREDLSKSKAAAALLTDGRAVRESEYDDIEDLLESADRVDELEDEIAEREARAEDLRRQLQAANSKDERVDKLATYVEEERRVEQQWREAGILTKTKWRLFGMPSEEQESA
jgi:predicted transcriptional regulator